MGCVHEDFPHKHPVFMRRSCTPGFLTTVLRTPDCSCNIKVLITAGIWAFLFFSLALQRNGVGLGMRQCGSTARMGVVLLVLMCVNCFSCRFSFIKHLPPLSEELTSRPPGGSFELLTSQHTLQLVSIVVILS